MVNLINKYLSDNLMFPGTSQQASWEPVGGSHYDTHISFHVICVVLNYDFLQKQLPGLIKAGNVDHLGLKMPQEMKAYLRDKE